MYLKVATFCLGAILLSSLSGLQSEAAHQMRSRMQKLHQKAQNKKPEDHINNVKDNSAIPSSTTTKGYIW